jgi:uncharacterized protein (DUF1800 family)
MTLPLDRQIEHLLRRAGFGARSDELETYARQSVRGAVETLLDYESIPDDVDQKIGRAGYVGMTARAAFSPRTVIIDARQRWLFRMIHTNRPLQEKMTLFWHNHFATAYTKIAGLLSPEEATRYLAAKPSEDPAGVRGQLEMLREHALGNFRDILLNIARDPAMLVWLDGRTNVKARPQENFGREIMELFTIGVGHYTEADVYAAARVFTGWNLARPGAAGDDTQRYEFAYVPGQHDTGDKTFSFPIYSGGSKTIKARPAADGMQDGLDLINALAAHPRTGRYLAIKLYRFFVSERGDVDPRFVDRVTAVYLQTRYDMKAVMREVLLSLQFWDDGAYFSRYSWPVEFVVRSIKDVGWRGFSVGEALAPLSNMGQNLYDPPDVAGWEVGRLWFSTGSMLARMNFASALAANQRFNLAAAASAYAKSPERLLAYVLAGLPTARLDESVTAELSNYLGATEAWTGNPAQLQAKVAGLVHLVASSAEYQLI